MPPLVRTVAAVAALLAAGVGASAAPARLGATPRAATSGAHPKVFSRLRVEQIVNGSFESSLSGWSAWQGSLSRTADGVVGAYAARVAAGKRVSSFAIGPSPAPVSSTVAGARYAAAAWVRTDKPGRQICLRIREWADTSTVLDSASRCVTGTSAWAAVAPVAYAAHASGHRLDAYVYVPTAVTGDSFEVDGVSLDLAAATATTTTQTTTTTAPTTTAPPASSCTRVISPGAELTSAVAALAPGQTLCLHGGTYSGNVDIRAGGAQGSPITITSYPGERGRIAGRLTIYDSANDVAVTNLDLDGANASGLPSPTVNGDRVVFRGNDVTNDHTGICFNLGSDDGYGTAVDVTIDANRIHDCGRLPSTNHDHGIYVDKSRGARITNNVIYDNADRGVQLYPDAQDTLVEHNVIDGNGTGVIFSGDLGFASSGNVVRGNVIADSGKYGLDAWWPAGNPVGTGNVASSNCLWNSANVGDTTGWSAGGNVVADPQFVDRAGKDFRLRAGSPCAGMGPA